MQLQQLFVKVAKFGYIIIYRISTYSEIDVMHLIRPGYHEVTMESMNFITNEQVQSRVFLGAMLAVCISKSRAMQSQNFITTLLTINSL